jgi:proline-specific peptidase
MTAFATSDGRRLAYRREGSGPILVCHPGGPGYSGLTLTPLLELADARTVVLVDPRGTGGSDRAASYELDDYVSDLDELRAHLGLEQLDLLGHSHGGVVSIAYASTHPERVRRLVLVGAPVRFSEEYAAAARERIESRAHEPWYEEAVAAHATMRAGDYANEDELTQLDRTRFPLYFADFGEREERHLDATAETRNADATRAFFNTTSTGAFDLRPRLAEITAPALVLAGERDFVAGPVSARELADGLRDARVLVLERCGHYPFVETPDEFRRAVLEFLA